MRPDVKLGVVISLVIVLVAGGYYLYRGTDEASIPVAGNPSAGSGSQADSSPPGSTKIASADSRKSAAGRPKTTPGSAKSRKSPGRGNPAPNAKPKSTESPERQVNPASERVAEKPADEPVVTPRRARQSGKAGQTGANKPAADKHPRSRRTAAAPKNDPLEAGEGVGANKETSPPAAKNPRVAATRPETNSLSPKPGVGGSNNRPTANSGAPSTAGRQANRSTSRTKQPPSDAVDTHKVQPGDTISGLAKAYYGHEKYIDFLAKANPQLADPGRLSVGSVVRIPPAPADGDLTTTTSPGTRLAAATRPHQQRTYTVESGDSFYSIAGKVLGDSTRWKELFDLNSDLVRGNPKRLQIGQVLVLPN